MRYKPGAYIVSLDHLMGQELVYYGRKLLHKGWFGNWQLCGMRKLSLPDCAFVKLSKWRKNMKPKTKSELMAEWASQPGHLKKEREVKAVRKAMDDARAVMQDGLTRYVKKKTKARSMAKAEADPFAELEGWESMEQIQDAYGYGEITTDRLDKLTDLWEAREAARNSRKSAGKYHDLVTEMLETAIRRVGNEYADMLFEYDQQRREAEKQCEQLAMEGMMKK